MRDKRDRVKELAEKLSEELLCSGGYEVSSPNTFEADASRILRTKLAEPLEAAQRFLDKYESDSLYRTAEGRKLAAELQGWLPGKEQ